jgi:hypothetical protein
MSLARAWTRQLYGASGAALLVPGTIVVALALLGLAGGFGQLGSLGQAFAGPGVPGGVQVAAKFRGSTAKTPLVSVRTPTPASAGAALTGSTATAVSPAGASPATGSHGQRGPGPAGFDGGGGNRGGSSGHTGGSGQGGPGGTTTPPTTTPSPTAHPTLVDGVVSVGTTITKALPGPIGSVATQLLQNLGKSVDGILPLSRGSTAANPSQAPGTAAPSTAQ